jgi:hypothetical protein
MTLLDYQRALADMIASPELCLRVRRDPEGTLREYALSPREHRRLAAVAHQPGMSTSCTLHRVNRMTPLVSYLPLTCVLLGDRLMPEVERFWLSARPVDLQFGPETRRFARFLQSRLRDGQLQDPYLEEVLAFEMAANQLLARLQGVEPPTLRHLVTGPGRVPRALHPHVAIVRFTHDPLPLLQAVADGGRPDPEPTVGEFFIAIDVREGHVQVSELDPATAASLALASS